HKAKCSAKLSGSNNPNFGKQKSEESKIKSRAANLGQKRSEETKQRMSEAQRKRFSNATSRANNE
ncbi:MAG: NUMOD3 domain-containing DNA-binding protein, partial [Lentisphaerota bacterium]